MRYLSTIMAIGICTGCTIGSKYDRPSHPLPSQFRSDATTATESTGTTLGELAWWDVFKDPVLQELIRTALENNYDLQIAATRVLEARAQLTSARSGYFPSLTANGRLERNDMFQIGDTSLAPESGLTLQLKPDGTPGITRIQPNRANPENGNEKAFASIDAAWELDVWGRIQSASSAARADLLATEEARNAVRQSLVTDVASTYFTLCSLDLELDIANRALTSRQKSLRLVQARKDRGVASRLDVRQSEVLVNTAASKIPDLERQIAQQENLISLLLGRNPGDVKRGASLTEQQLVPEVPAGLPSIMLERRPDIRAAEQQLIAADARIAEARALFFPRISLTAALGIVSPAVAGAFEGPAGTTTIAPVASLPIFQGGKLRANLQRTKARREEAVLNYHKTINAALRDTSDALVALQKYRELRVQQERSVETLTDAAHLSHLRYVGGVSSYLEVLDSERQLFDAQLGLAQARRLELLSIVQLYKALGGGWSELEPASTH